MRRRQKYEEFLGKVELLQGMEEYDRVSLADAVVEDNYKQGEYIIRQGEKGDRFFFILNGEAVVTKRIGAGKPNQQVMNYLKGSYFGELALINDAPRAANVVAKTDVDLISLDKDTFVRIMGTADDLIRRNMDKYEGYEIEVKFTHDKNVD